MDRIPSRLLLLLVMLLVPVLSHQPSLKPPFELFPHQDKVFHLIEFGGLALAMVLNRDLFSKAGDLRGMAVLGLIWAVLDEVHQSFVPGRDCSLQDLAADAVGLAAGILLFSTLLAGRRRRG